MDVLADILSSMRLSGGVFLDSCFGEPWSVMAEIRPVDVSGFFPEPRHLIGYHYVRSGELYCQTGDSGPVKVLAGEIVLLPRNDPHLLFSDADCTPVDASSLVQAAADDGLARIRAGGDGPRTEFYCGFLGTETPDNSLIQSLPSQMTVEVASEGEEGWVAESLHFAAEGPGARSPELVGKLAEALFAEAIRRYVAQLPPGEGGWLAGLGDPAVGKALALIHQRYAESWTAESLAQGAGVSKTVLNERFRHFLDVPPMQYLAGWRMRTAVNRLREPGQNAGSIAYSVGFNSEAAFSRAFKREFGVPPATWRRKSLAEEPPGSAPGPTPATRG
jgi:AraC-like DNA-binding protein